MFELFQPTHLLFVLLVALVAFGPKRLIEVSRQAGQFAQRMQEFKEEIKEELAESAKDKPEEKFPEQKKG